MGNLSTGSDESSLTSVIKKRKLVSVSDRIKLRHVALNVKILEEWLEPKPTYNRCLSPPCRAIEEVRGPEESLEK